MTVTTCAPTVEVDVADIHVTYREVELPSACPRCAGRPRGARPSARLQSAAMNATLRASLALLLAAATTHRRGPQKERFPQDTQPCSETARLFAIPSPWRR